MLHLYVRTKPNRVGCNIWQGSIDPRSGHARVKVNGKWCSVHRLTYAREYGLDYAEVPRLYNYCGRKNCINPHHWDTFPP